MATSEECRPGGAADAGMVVSPITGELVPLAEMAEHMRISLIDPQWRTQREAMLSKIRETTQAGDDEITRNLVDLAGHRPDVFGEPLCPVSVSSENSAAPGVAEKRRRESREFPPAARIE